MMRDCTSEPFRVAQIIAIVARDLALLDFIAALRKSR
jgi:hypothetical protein